MNQKNHIKGSTATAEDAGQNAQATVSDDSSSDSMDRTRRWMLTLPGRLDDSFDVVTENGAKCWTYLELKAELKEAGWSAAFQLEAGEETGYTHWQLYIEHDHVISFAGLKKRFPQAHLEVARTPRKVCVSYCTKQDTRLFGPFFEGNLRLEDSQGRRIDVEEMRDEILRGTTVDDVLLNFGGALRYVSGLRELEGAVRKKAASGVKRAVKVEYLWGKTGTGKTWSTFERFGFENVYCLPDYSNGAMDQYSGEEVLFLDEFASDVKITTLLKWLDIYPLQLSARYHNKWASWTTVIIASNSSLDEQYRDHLGVSSISAERRRALDRRIGRVAEVVGQGEFIEELPGSRF